MSNELAKPSWYNEPSGTMKAAVLTAPGASPATACFTIDNAYPKPTIPNQDWVLVRVHAAGLNRAELRSRDGFPGHILEFNHFRNEYRTDPPAIIGEEFVGVVEVAGSNTIFKPGDKVAAWMFGGGKAFNGSYAEYAVSPKDCVVKLQTTLPWDVLGGAIMSMWTSYGALVLAADMQPNTLVVIHGATSSVGLWSVLLAKDKGCTVIATTRRETKREKLKLAGADHVLIDDGNVPNLLAAIKEIAPNGVNTWFEVVGPEFNDLLAFPSMARHGTVANAGMLTMKLDLGNWSPVTIGPTRKLTMYTTYLEDMEPATKVFQDVVDKIEKGIFKPEVFMDEVFPLEKIGEAHVRMEENKATGKIVITI